MNDQLTTSLHTMTGLVKLRYGNGDAEIWSEIQKAEALLDAEFALKQDLLASLLVMTALVKLRYGNEDPDIWAEIQKAEEVYETVRKEQYPVE